MNGAPLSKSTGVGNHLPLAHGRDERTHGGSHICIEEQVTKDIPAGIVVHQRELIGRPIQIGEGDLLQEVPVPEAVRVVSFIEAPHGSGGGGHIASWSWRLSRLMVAGLIVRCSPLWRSQAMRCGPRYGFSEMTAAAR